MAAHCEHFTIRSVEACKRGLVTGREMGKGDFGVTFAIDNFTEEYTGSALRALQEASSLEGEFVLKKILLQDQTAKSNYAREVHIGRILGESSIAPKIHDCWTCVESIKSKNKTYGYIVMDRMSEMWKKKYNLKIASNKHQIQLIRCLATMIKLGFLHQDCHVGNIGFDKDDNVVLFDFGLSVEIPSECMDSRSLAIMLVSQLRIVIEQYSIADKQGSNPKRNYLRDMIFYIESNLSPTLDDVLLLISNENFVLDKQILKAPEIARPRGYTGTLLSMQQELILTSFINNRDFATYCPRLQMAIALNIMYEQIEEYDVGHFSDDYNSEDFPNLMYDLIYDIRKGLVNNVSNISDWLDTKAPVDEKAPVAKKRKSDELLESLEHRKTRSRKLGGKKTRKNRRRKSKKVRFVQV